MGIGDEIMAAGQAEKLSRELKEPVAIVGGGGVIRTHDIWRHNPWITTSKSAPRIKNAGGCRPYLKYPWDNVRGKRFTDWRAADNVASIFLIAGEINYAGRAIGAIPNPRGLPILTIEPNIKPAATVNKDWGFDRYRELAARLRDVCLLIQTGPRGTKWLEHVYPIQTKDFREAVAVQSHSIGHIGAEGALHHSAAALRLPAVVLFGSSSPVYNLGYRGHFNMAYGEVCGRQRPCDHCRAAMAAITVDEVEAAVLKLLNGEPPDDD